MPLQSATEFLRAGKELELVKWNIQFQISTITFAICPNIQQTLSDMSPFWPVEIPFMLSKIKFWLVTKWIVNISNMIVTSVNIIFTSEMKF